MDKYTLEALNNILNNTFVDEACEQYQELNKPKGHFYEDILLVTSWVDKEMKERGLI